MVDSGVGAGSGGIMGSDIMPRSILLLPTPGNNMEDWVQETLKELKDESKEVRSALGRIDVTLAAQHVSLVDHVRRTQLLEQRVDGWWLKVLSVVGGIGGVLTAAGKIFGWY